MGIMDDARKGLRLPVTLWLGVALSVMSRAQAANPFAGGAPLNIEALIVLLAGVGVLLVAVVVLAFSIRQLRRDAAERRKIYAYRRHRPHRAAHGPSAPSD